MITISIIYYCSYIYYIYTYVFIYLCRSTSHGPHAANFRRPFFGSQAFGKTPQERLMGAAWNRSVLNGLSATIPMVNNGLIVVYNGL